MVTRNFNWDSSVMEISIPLNGSGNISNHEDIKSAFGMVIAQTYVEVSLRDIEIAFYRAIRPWATDDPPPREAPEEEE